MTENAAGRMIPESVENIGKLKPFKGAYEYTPLVKKDKGNRQLPKLNKLADSIEDAVKKCGLKDGMTISFHHHFRSGDRIVNAVMDVIAGMGIKGLTLAASSLTDVHSPLVGHIKKRSH